MIASIMATLAEFERDLVRERVRSGLAAAKARGKQLGRKLGQRVKSDRYTLRVLQMVGDGYSYRYIRPPAKVRDRSFHIKHFEHY
jgi:putative DNA-invertase from lambdoid prophage Rac